MRFPLNLPKYHLTTAHHRGNSSLFFPFILTFRAEFGETIIVRYIPIRAPGIGNVTRQPKPSGVSRVDYARRWSKSRELSVNRAIRLPEGSVRWRRSMSRSRRLSWTSWTVVRHRCLPTGRNMKSKPDRITENANSSTCRRRRNPDSVHRIRPTPNHPPRWVNWSRLANRQVSLRDPILS